MLFKTTLIVSMRCAEKEKKVYVPANECLLCAQTKQTAEYLFPGIMKSADL